MTTDADHGAGGDAAPAGWYPTKGTSLRWWDGAQWTPHVAWPKASKTQWKDQSRGRQLGHVLVWSPALLMSIGGLAVMGHSFPDARVGVAVRDGALSIVPVTCPGERYEAIEIRRLLDEPGSETEELIWRVEGDAAATVLVVGQTPEGMTQTVRLVGGLSPTDQLTLLVETNQVQPMSGLRFSINEIPTDGLIGEGGVAENEEQLRAHADDDASCGDRHGTNLKRKLSFGFTGASAAFALTGVIILYRTRKQSWSVISSLPG